MISGVNSNGPWPPRNTLSSRERSTPSPVSNTGIERGFPRKHVFAHAEESEVVGKQPFQELRPLRRLRRPASGGGFALIPAITSRHASVIVRQSATAARTSASTCSRRGDDFGAARRSSKRSDGCG